MKKTFTVLMVGLLLLLSMVSLAGAALILEGPTADAGGPYDLVFGNDLVLDGSASYDPNVSIIAYEWDLDGNNTFGDVSGVMPTVDWTTLESLLGTLSVDDVFDVALEVENSNGASSASQAYVTILPYSAPASAPVPEPGTVLLFGAALGGLVLYRRKT